MVEVGVNYALIITTNSGLWRYKIGDTIIFTNLKPFRIKISGRTKHFINTFGEEVIIENVEKSLEIALKKYNCSIKDFTVAPLFMKNGKKGKHEWMIEFVNEPSNINEFMREIDLQIQNNNSDYKAKRFKNITLDKPSIIKARKNLFYDWLKKKKKLGGQNKIPRLLNDRSFISELIKMN